MIVDSISNYQKYVSLHKGFEKAFSFLRELREDASEGTTMLEEDNMWANIIEISYVPESDNIFEAHRNFLDIHYILSGEEKFGYANCDHLNTVERYNAIDDIELLEGEINEILLKKGDFMITFPEDAHIADYQKVNDNTLKRVVVKIRI